ncbi:uncharacterized protein GMORB2_1442 [Geosmithia morbida]|uniref:Gpr1 family protein n=1 Tax=Geosmithia morbida TaxID=1094350 RepID=A0A9P5D732_9HYPO|nr:uncharacterized protein GMORB2_1442 [Geosmithia morbida]KAF4126196.1 uncharacterized protein GMORB2_1442 [Geosmithia morbida]
MAAKGTEAQYQDFANSSNGQSSSLNKDLDINGGGDHVEKPPQRQGTISHVYQPSFLKAANPGPLGLISFAVSGFTLALYQLGVGLPDSNPMGSVGPNQAIFGLSVFLGGAIQVFAGIMEFRVGNTFGSTLHCIYGGFWLSYGMFFVPALGIKEAYAGDTHAYTTALGIYLMSWTLITLLFLLAALRTNIAILSLLFCLMLTFLLLGVAQFIATTATSTAITVNKAGGGFLVITSLIAFYAGCSGLMVPETTFIRFPLGDIESLTRRK